MAEPTDADLDNLLDEALDDFESQTRSSIPTGKPNANATLPDALKDVKLADSGSQQQGEIPSNEQKFADSMKNILSSDDFAKKILEDVDGGDLNALLDEFSKTFKAERAATEAEGAAGASSAGAASTSATTSGVEEDELQKNISATLENLSAGVKKLEDTKNPDEFLDKLLDEFGEEGEMGGMMETMMKQLMAKDILYEPLKDMSDKYPGWLEANKPKLSVEDYARYEKQYSILQQIVKLYDTEGDAAFQTVMNLMQEMQESGQPPAEIVSELAPGVSFGSDGLPILPGLGEDGGKSCSIM